MSLRSAIAQRRHAERVEAKKKARLEKLASQNRLMRDALKELIRRYDTAQAWPGATEIRKAREAIVE